MPCVNLPFQGISVVAHNRTKKTGSGVEPDPATSRILQRYGAQAGSPSPAVETTGLVVPTAIPHDVFANCVWLFVADQ